MIEIAAAIEDHLLDALFLRALGNQLAHFLGRRNVAAGLLLGGQGGGGNDGYTLASRR